MKVCTKKLDLAMARKCLSSRELAKLTELGEATIGNLRGGKQEARTQTIGKIAKVLGVDVSEIIEQ